MEQSPELKLSPRRLKHLFTHCSLAARRISEKKLLREDISGRIQKLKELSAKGAAGKKPRSEILEELHKLEKKVGEIIETQSRERAARSELMRKLEQKIEAVQPAPSTRALEDFERISARLAENAQKIHRIGEAEKKLEKEVGEEKGELGRIEEKLRSLEQEYNRLRKKKGIKKSDLDRVKSIIEKHKKTISKLRSG